MKVDFEKLSAGKTIDNVTIPREIFALLPRKAGSFPYLRDVQAEVLNAWFARRNEKDLVLKMNTGSGKTLVGLLILKSSLNDGKKPAVYVVPDNYLIQQVSSQAENLGIATTTDTDDLGFINGKKILVVNIYKLINGKSVFGVAPEQAKINIGSLVIDDVHACLSTTESQFTLRISSGEEAYKEVLELFLDDLQQQSDTGVREVQDGDPQKFMLVPFWSWVNKIDKVVSILHKVRDSKSTLFVWPLIKEDLKLCRCVLSGDGLEISPLGLPIDAIPSFVDASRRIFMSATLSDDSILVSHFNVPPAAVSKCVTPSASDDIGDRMILVPEELNPEITGGELKAFVRGLAAKHNVIVIVPSTYRVSLWSDVADMILSADNLEDGVKELRKRHVGLVVLLNKYDGVDLPQDACRVLVLDGLPDVRRKIDKVEQSVLAGSDYVLGQMIQRIEQGMGRGIRSNDDYCVVILKGKALTRHLYVQGAAERFTPATKAQFELSSSLADQIRGLPIDRLKEIVAYCLNRDEKWVEAGRRTLVNLKYKPEGSVSEIANGRRRAFDLARMADFEGAKTEIQSLVSKVDDARVRGWLKEELAWYEHFINPVHSQQILQSAVKDNRYVLRPVQGIVYNKLDAAKIQQAAQLSNFLKQSYPDGNKLVLQANSLIEQLVFVPETSEEFEEAMKQLAFHIGFLAQRPDKETGKGPDVLWMAGGRMYFVIECKNGVVTEEINKHDCDQLSGSMSWFKLSYDPSCRATPVMVHPVEVFNSSASPISETRIIQSMKLDELKNAFGKFISSLARLDFSDTKEIAKLLIAHSFTSDLFLTKYSVKSKLKKK